MILRFLFFLFIFYLAYNFVRRLFVRPFSQGYSQNGRSANGQANSNSSSREGDVSINFDPRNKKAKKGSDDLGDYIDYEEVKD